MRKITIIIDSKLFAYTQHQRYKPIIGLIDEVARFILIAKDKLNLTQDEMLNKKTIWAMDTGIPIRADMLKKYKANRKEKAKKLDRYEQERLEKFKTLYPKLEGVFGKLGIAISIDRVEADDIASIIAYNKQPDEVVIMISSDRDWTKFLKDNNTYIINPSKKGLMYNRTGVLSVMGWTPTQKVVIDAFCGVKKEDIQGIDWLGYKTFNKKVWDKLDDKYKASEDYETVVKKCAMIIEKYDVLTPRMLASIPDGSSAGQVAMANLKLTTPFTSTKELVDAGVTADVTKLEEAIKKPHGFRTVEFKTLAQELNKVGQPVKMPEPEALKAFNILI